MCKLEIENAQDMKKELLKSFDSKNFVCTDKEKQCRCNTIFEHDYIKKLFSDCELITTALLFFENNLNMSLTSKAGYMHRNTLIYRIEKIKSIIGLDIRNFNEATILQNIINIRDKYIKNELNN